MINTNLEQLISKLHDSLTYPYQYYLLDNILFEIRMMEYTLNSMIDLCKKELPEEDYKRLSTKIKQLLNENYGRGTT